MEALRDKTGWRCPGCPVQLLQNSGELGETQTQIAETSGGPPPALQDGPSVVQPGRWGLVTQSSPELTPAKNLL